MKEQEIIEGNKLIAEFMGMKVGKLRGWLSGETQEECAYRKNEHDEVSEAYPLSKLKYHSSWDWLMPVVEKIAKWHEEMPETDEMLDSIEEANLLLFRLRITTTSIKEVWLAVVDFIKWYNQNKATA